MDTLVRIAIALERIADRLESVPPPKPKSLPSPPARFDRPSLDDVIAFVSTNRLRIDAEAFFDYYQANGWKVGKNSMKDWRATARNWARKDWNRKEESPNPEPADDYAS
jgi:hypothetical protein